MYKSTRGTGECVKASEAILKGLSKDGGLFVPTSIPRLDIPMEKLAEMTYQEIAYEVMSRFLTDFTEEELKHVLPEPMIPNSIRGDRPSGKGRRRILSGAVSRSDHSVQGYGTSILPHLLTTSAKKNHVKNEIVIPHCHISDTAKQLWPVSQMCRYKDHCLLSQEWCQPHPGKTDGDTEGK